MRKPSASKPVLVLAAAVLATVAAAGTPPPALDFDQVFATRGEPASLHYEVQYRTADGTHTLAVWRSGQTQLHRRSDARLDTYVERSDGDTDYRMTVLDHARRIETRVTRNSLYRIGRFTDWDDLAHGLRHPRAAYTLVADAAPAGAPQPLAACHWYRLDSATQHSRLCWSRQYRLPLQIHDGDSPEPVWRVSRVSTAAIDAREFSWDDRDYARTDASADIERD